MKGHTVRVQPRWTAPREQFAEFARKPYCVWLDTPDSLTGHGKGRYSILAAEPAKIFRSKGSKVEIISAGGAASIEGNPFDLLNAEIAQHTRDNAAPFPDGCAIGYFGYELKNFVETLPARAVDDIGLPDCWFGFYENLLVFDHAEQKLTRVGGESAGNALPPSETATPKARRGQMQSSFTRESYGRAILRAKEYIAAGDIYQVNLSQRFQCSLDVAASELYLALRESNPAPYCAYLDIGNAQILSSSPECFLNIHDRCVETRPIKGTRPRGKTPDEDKRIAQELLSSAKDNAELLMITDLERNDLGRVCQFGSVWVRELKRVETYATVHHLVSTIEGLLRCDVSHVDCVRACFPGGSITGAPKIRAMQIIDELEPHARGVYTGAIGFLGFNGVSHFNIAIRTAVYQRGRLTFHAGGGIVADSEPDAEYDETLAKARGITNAIDHVRVRQRPLFA